MSSILETTMLVLFGISWPMAVIESYKVRTTKGKSLAFLCLVLFGWIAGITSKFMNNTYMANFDKLWYVVVCYIYNFSMALTDFFLYMRNYKLDKKNGVL